VVAASDYVRAWPQLMASYLTAPFTALGTDGFGRSDTRAALRRFFEVDRHQIVLAALTALRAQGLVDAACCAEAIARYGIPVEQTPAWER
jgi:pyruvate dehydrogenase E1 component